MEKLERTFTLSEYLEFPVLCVFQDIRSLIVIRNYDALHKCKYGGIGNCRNLLLIDSEGKTVDVLNLTLRESCSAITRVWYSIVNPWCEVELNLKPAQFDLDDRKSLLAVEDVKKIIFSDINSNSELWESVVGIDELLHSIQNAKSVRELIELLA